MSSTLSRFLAQSPKHLCLQAGMLLPGEVEYCLGEKAGLRTQAQKVLVNPNWRSVINGVPFFCKTIE